MHTDVDLPAPGLLWTRWATLAASLTGLGFTGAWFVDARGARHDDREGGWARLVLLDGARAVLFGRYRDHGETAELAGAPAWLPRGELAKAGPLGFAAWHDQGRWQRGRGADPAHAVRPVLSGEETLSALIEVVAGWGGYELRTPAERDDVRQAGELLLAAAVRGQVTAVDVERLLGRITDPPPDLRAALSVAARAGLTPGTHPPRFKPPEHPRPGDQLKPGERPTTRRPPPVG